MVWGTRNEVRAISMLQAVSVLQGKVNKYKNEGYVESWGLIVEKACRHLDDDNYDYRMDNFHEYEYDRLYDDDNDDDDEYVYDDEPNNFFWWNRFLTILSSQESSKIRLVGIQFFWSYFGRPNDEVLERFFRDVLPNLASLTEIRFYYCQILPAYMDMFLTSLSNNNNNNNVNLRTLEFHGKACQFDPSSVAAIARLLSCAKYGNGNGTPIEHLCLGGCSIHSTGCELILKALDGNTCLQRLELTTFNNISEISLDAARALGNCKNLRVLGIGLSLSDQSVWHLAEGLRTNHSLINLYIGWETNPQVALDAFAELLKTFNYRLHELSGNVQGMEELLLQNQRIRRLLDNLLEGGNSSSNTTMTSITAGGSYRLPQLFLWPPALDCIGSKPSCIYRFIRHGNLESFTNQVLRSAEFASAVGTGVAEAF